MASKAQLLLPSVKIPQTSSVSSMLASTNQVLSNLNTQLQQISSAFTLNKPVSTPDGTTGGITVGNITMGSNNFIRAGATGYNAGTGFWMGYDTSPTPGYKFFIGSTSGNKLVWNGSTLSITGSITATTGTIGGWSIGPDYIQDAAGVVGLSSAVTGADDIRFWAGNAVKNNAPFKVTEAGVLTASSGTVGGWTLSTTQFSGSNLFLNSAGYIRAGQTAYNTGTGFWLGLDSSTPKFSIGNASNNYLTWDGTNLLMQGGTTPNFVRMTSTTFEVGIAGAKRVALGTFNSNPASFNIYDSGGVSRLGVFISTSGVPTVTCAASITPGAESYVTLSSGTSSSGWSMRADHATGQANAACDVTLGTAVLGLSSVAGFTGVGPYLYVFNSTTSKTCYVYGDAFRATDGTSAVPAYSFTSDTDTGWRWNSSGDMRATCNGNDVFVVRSAAIVCLQPLKLANAFVAGAPAATGYVTVQDSNGTTYKLLAAP